MGNEDFIVWCDDSNMPSPQEEAQYPPLTPEQERRLDERIDKSLEGFWEKFGLTDDYSKIPANFADITKYILEKQGNMSTWRLQKLCYYAQAWHYTWTDERLIKEDFQAWKHGPVCRELFNLHKGKHTIKAEDIDGNSGNLTDDQKDSIDIVLEHYGKFTSDELVALTHAEDPWKKARGDLPADAHSENIITVESMGEYYRKHLI